MKISDPLGKVYTHTMFKKKSYDIATRDGVERGDDDSEDEEDAVSEISEQSDDSLSTKSSRVEASRGRSTSSRRASPTNKGDVEQDREDAISYASRHQDRSSRGGRRKETKRFGLENLGPPGTSYSLWSAQRSLKRDHKRKFNRSLCGVLLGIRKVWFSQHLTRVLDRAA